MSDRVVVPFPLHRRSTLDETLQGYARPTGATIPGSRRARRLTMILAELRGWADVARRAGTTSADRLLAAATTVAIDILRERGAAELTVGGTEHQPVLSAVFEGDAQAERALGAAAALRDGVADLVLPELSAHRVRACAGVNTGEVVQTEVSGGQPVSFQAVGTIRMFATRLQEFAGPGQVFVAASTVADAPGARVRPIGPVRTNADGGTSDAFCLVEAEPGVAGLPLAAAGVAHLRIDAR
jgi:class 3 adenylate cyclase